jgi:hypothetical protein
MLASLCPINRTIHARSFAENSNDAGGLGGRSNVSSVEWLDINASTNFGVMPYNPRGGCLDLVNNILIGPELTVEVERQMSALGVAGESEDAPQSQQRGPLCDSQNLIKSVRPSIVPNLP